MYDLSDLPKKKNYCNGTENYKLSHNHNIVNCISTRMVGDFKCLPITHQICRM